MKSESKLDKTKDPPFETRELRRKLQEFLDSEIVDPATGKKVKIGNYKFGVYAFFDYDGEPIYVGQTNEKLRTRIRRHLTNQRTDAVAMNVLDPFEVYEVEVWPLTQFEGRATGDVEAANYLNALEYEVFETELSRSRFKAVLNEVEPGKPGKRAQKPKSYRRRIVSEEVFKIRSHPDLRIARRAATLARLAHVISERRVQSGLRKTLLTQAKRLEWLAERRYEGAADEIEDSEASAAEDEDHL
ncbi:GIY-YIG nuclease family protein [Candidatus Binatus sp.]|uniref:GIY-YIG nuclease family protein n=1 Tax=Candidatus Binatus sp. TaxID=2811406 RepID=UPI003C986F30